jgi:hypothetical protein
VGLVGLAGLVQSSEAREFFYQCDGPWCYVKHVRETHQTILSLVIAHSRRPLYVFVLIGCVDFVGSKGSLGLVCLVGIVG